MKEIYVQYHEISTLEDDGYHPEYIWKGDIWKTDTIVLTPQNFQKYLTFKSLEGDGKPFDVKIDYEYREATVKGSYKTKYREALFTDKYTRRANNVKLQLFQNIVDCIKGINGVSYTISEEKLLRDVRENYSDRGIVYGKTINVKVSESFSAEEYGKAIDFKKRICENHKDIIDAIENDTFARAIRDCKQEYNCIITKKMINGKHFSDYGMADLQDVYQVAGLIFAIWRWDNGKEAILTFDLNERATVNIRPKAKDIQDW